MHTILFYSLAELFCSPLALKLHARCQVAEDSDRRNYHRKLHWYTHSPPVVATVGELLREEVLLWYERQCFDLYINRLFKLLDSVEDWDI